MNGDNPSESNIGEGTYFSKKQYYSGFFIGLVIRNYCIKSLMCMLLGRCTPLFLFMFAEFTCGGGIHIRRKRMLGKRQLERGQQQQPEHERRQQLERRSW